MLNLMQACFTAAHTSITDFDVFYPQLPYLTTGVLPQLSVYPFRAALPLRPCRTLVPRMLCPVGASLHVIAVMSLSRLSADQMAIRMPTAATENVLK